jgi:hypothetical protein
VKRGARRARRGDGIVDVLLGHGLVVAQLAIAVGLVLGGDQIGLGAFDLRGDLIARGAVGARIDHIQRLTRLHIAAFLEQALADDAVDLGRTSEVVVAVMRPVSSVLSAACVPCSST